MVEGNDSRSVSSYGNRSEPKLEDLRFGLAPEASNECLEGFEEFLEWFGEKLVALSEDVRVVIENVVPVGDCWSEDVLGLADPTWALGSDIKLECLFSKGFGLLRRALRSGTGGGCEADTGSLVEVVREKLLADSGVAGGEGGAYAETGTVSNVPRKGLVSRLAPSPCLR